jgi:hypothetical protein
MQTQGEIEKLIPVIFKIVEYCKVQQDIKKGNAGYNRIDFTASCRVSDQSFLNDYVKKVKRKIENKLIYWNNFGVITVYLLKSYLTSEIG